MLLPTQVACIIRVCRCMGITAFYGAPLEDAAAITLLQGVYDAGTAHSCAVIAVSLPCRQCTMATLVATLVS
jgi:hypothetical protein